MGSMKAINVLVSICLFFMASVIASPTFPIDDDQAYEQYQDINKALQNNDSLSWMFNRTYRPNPKDPEYECVYANVSRVSPQGPYVFFQGWTTEEKKITGVPLHVTTIKTAAGYTRKWDNAMEVELKLPNGTTLRKFGTYKLVYSDYQKCDILRVMEKGGVCEMYVHSNYLKEGIPEECACVYRLACLNEATEINYQVYESTCKTLIDPKGC